MDWGKRIGANLKQMRTERNLTLGQLSGLAGISKAMLSEMEKGMGNPTINTIWKIANGLKVPYTRLLEGSEPRPRGTATIGCTAIFRGGRSGPLSCFTWNWTPIPPTPPQATWPRHRNISRFWRGS